MKKRILLHFATILMGISEVNANFYVNGISYVIETNGKVRVNGYKYDADLDDVSIPPTVSYQDYTYEVREIGYNALNGCSSIVSVTIPATVVKLDDGAFNKCANLSKIEIKGQGLKEIDAWAFANTAISEITIPESVTLFEGSTLRDCKNLTSVTLNATINTIPSDMCSGCENLTFISIPENITTIQDRAFQDCDMHEVEIPSGVTKIGWEIFKGNKNIIKVTSHIMEPMNISYNNFEQTVYENAVLYVPKGTIELYRKKDGWKNFLKIEEIVMMAGDVNNDGGVTMADANMIVNAFLNGQALDLETADVNGDGNITMADANLVVNIFLQGK